MSDFDEMLDRARRMKWPQVQSSIKSLARDSRFEAVVAWLYQVKEGFAEASSHQDIAGNPGKITHAAGSHHALRVLEGQLRRMVDPQKTTAPMEQQGGSD